MEKTITLRINLQTDSSKLSAEIDKALKARQLSIDVAGSGVYGRSLPQTDFRSALQSLRLEQQVDRIVKAIQDNKPSLLSRAAGVAGRVAGAALSPLAAIGRGSLEGFGRDIGKDFSKGISEAIATGTSGYFGSGELLGKKLVNAISKQVGDGLESVFERAGGRSLSKALTGENLGLKGLSNKLIGETDVEIERLSAAQKQRRATLTKVQQAASEADRQQAELLQRSFLDKDSLLGLSKELQVATAELEKLDEQFQKVSSYAVDPKTKKAFEDLRLEFQQTAKARYELLGGDDSNRLFSLLTKQIQDTQKEIAGGASGQKLKIAQLKLQDLGQRRDQLVSPAARRQADELLGKMNQIRLSIQQIEAGEPGVKKAEALEFLSNSIEKTSEKIQRLEKEYSDLLKKIKSDKGTIDALGGVRQGIKPTAPFAYQRAFESVAGAANAPKMPKLVVADALLAREGAKGAYSVESNSILVTKSLMEAIQANRLSDEQNRVLLEEIAHAVQFDFGSEEGKLYSQQQQAMSRVSSPTGADRRRYASVLEKYAPEKRQFELEAKLRAEQESSKLIERQRQQANLQRLEKVAGVGGSGLQSKLFGPQLKSVAKDLAELREVINRFALLEVDPQALNSLESLKAELNRIFGALTEFNEAVPAAQDSSADEIEALMVRVGEEFQALERLRLRVNDFADTTLSNAELQARWEGMEPGPGEIGPITPVSGGREAPDPWADPTAIQRVEQSLEGLVGQGTIANKVFNGVADELRAVHRELARLLGAAWKPLLSLPEDDKALLRKYLNQQAMRAGRFAGEMAGQAGQFTGRLANTAIQGIGGAYNLASGVERNALRMLGPIGPLAKAGLQAGVVAPGAFLAASHFPVVGAGMQMAQSGLAHLMGAGAGGLGGQLGAGAADLISQATSGVPLIQGVGAKLATQLPGAIGGLTGAAGEAIGGYVGAVVTGLAAMGTTQKLVEDGAKKLSESLPEPLKIPISLSGAPKLPQLSGGRSVQEVGAPKLPPAKPVKIALPSKVQDAASQTVDVAAKTIEAEVIESIAETRRAIQGMDPNTAKTKANEIKEGIQKAHRLFRETLESGNAELAMGYAKSLVSITEQARKQIDELLGQVKGGELPGILGGIKGNLTNQLNKSQKLIQQKLVESAALDDTDLKASIGEQWLGGRKVDPKILESLDAMFEDLRTAANEFNIEPDQFRNAVHDLIDAAESVVTETKQLTTSALSRLDMLEAEIEDETTVSFRDQRRLPGGDGSIVQTQPVAGPRGFDREASRDREDNDPWETAPGGGGFVPPRPPGGGSTGIPDPWDDGAEDRLNSLRDISNNILEEADNKFIRNTEKRLKQRLDLERLKGAGSKDINATLKHAEDAADRFDAAERRMSQKISNRQSLADAEFDKLGKQLNGAAKVADDSSPKFSRFSGFVKELGMNLIGLLGAYSVADLLVRIGQTSVGAALDFKQLSAAVPTSKLKELRDEANEVGAIFQVAAKNYRSFYNATKRGSLSGQADDIFQGFLQGGAASQLNAEQQDSVFRAITQMASKGRVSLEELTGQLEALPDALGIAARSMGLTSEQMIKMVENGDVMSSVLLPKMARQLALESGVSLAAASESATSKLSRLQNSVYELQTTIGSGFLDAAMPAIDAANTGLKFLTQNADLLKIAVELLAGVAITQLISRSGALATQLGALTLIKKLAGVEAINLASATTLAGKASLVAGVGFKALGGLAAIAFKALVVPAVVISSWELFNASVNAGLEQTKKSTAAVTGLTRALADAYDDAADKAAKLKRNQPKSSNPVANFVDENIINPINDPKSLLGRGLESISPIAGTLGAIRQVTNQPVPTFGQREFDKANEIRGQRIEEVGSALSSISSRTPKDLDGIQRQSEALDRQLSVLRAQRDMYRLQGRDIKDIEANIKQVENAQRKVTEPVAVNSALLDRTKTTLETMRGELLEQSNLTDKQQQEYATGSEAVRAALLTQSGLTEGQLNQLHMINRLLTETEGRIKAINEATRKANEDRLKFVNDLKQVGYDQQNTDFKREDLDIQRKLNIAEQRSMGGLEFTQQRQVLELERKTQEERLKQLGQFRDKYEKVLKRMSADQRDSLEIYLGKPLEQSLPGDISRVRELAESNQITLSNAQEQALNAQEKILGIERQGWEARISLAENALQRRQALEERAFQRQTTQLEREVARYESYAKLFDSLESVGRAGLDLASGRAERSLVAADRIKSTLEGIISIDKEIARRREEAAKKAREQERSTILGSYDAAGDADGKAAFEAAFKIEDAAIAERDAAAVKREEEKQRKIETAKRNALKLNLVEQFGPRNAEELLTNPELALQALLIKRQEIERNMLNLKEQSALRELETEKAKLNIDIQREILAQKRAKLEANKESRDADRAQRAANVELESALKSGDKNRITNAQVGVQEANQAVQDAKNRQGDNALYGQNILTGFAAMLESLGIRQQGVSEQFASQRRDQRFEQRIQMGEAGLDPSKPNFDFNKYHQRQVDLAIQGNQGQINGGLLPTPQLPTPQLPAMPDPAVFSNQLTALQQITGNLGILPQFLTMLTNISASTAATASKPPVVVNQTTSTTKPNTAADYRRNNNL